jgi:GGDEF domain-containing protein
MPAALPDRRLLLGFATAFYVAVFGAVSLIDRPGLRVSRFFFVAVVLLALASGPLAGAGGGLLAAALYSVAVLVSPDLPDESLASLSMAIRLVTYVGVGCLIGFFADQHRAFADHLRLLADRDRLTGLPTSRTFEVELTRRIEDNAMFALLLGDVDGLGDQVDAGDTLQRLPSMLAHCLHPSDAIARVGPDEFAILATCRSSDEARALAGTLEATLRACGLDVIFGWTISPHEGRNGLGLYRAANERLYARKVVRRRSVAYAG